MAGGVDGDAGVVGVRGELGDGCAPAGSEDDGAVERRRSRAFWEVSKAGKKQVVPQG